jgi:hypothetical protein
MTFKELSIGQGFDWINPDSRANSFFKRCTKVSPRRYIDSDGISHRVGRTCARVYHVEPMATNLPASVAEFYDAHFA